MSGLYTDLYELRMAVSYLWRGMSGPATFSLFVRDLPPERGFLIAAGLADCLEFLEQFRFAEEEVEYLRAAGLPQEAARTLADVRFTGEVWAVPEGRVVLAGEPLLEVTAPIAQAQLVETALLNFVTFQTAVATKAARCRLAAGDADLIDFAFRRTHGLEAAVAVARSSAIAGFTATSNVEAARRYGLVPSGTMAHSFIEAFADERSAFAAFAEDHPGSTVFLVDTYDTLQGVRTAIEVTRRMRLPGPIGVRLDSGDLAGLAVAARRLLVEAGHHDARIVASGNLDEYEIAELVSAGAPIDSFGVGTRMGVSADAPSLNSAYKLVVYGDRPVMKLSAGKVTLPGAKQVFRAGRIAADGDAADDDGGGTPSGPDVIALRGEPVPDGRTTLLTPVMRDGRRLGGGDGYGPADDLSAARRRCQADLAALPAAARRLRAPVAPVAEVSPTLRLLQDSVRDSLLRRTGGSPAP